MVVVSEIVDSGGSGDCVPPAGGASNIVHDPLLTLGV